MSICICSYCVGNYSQRYKCLKNNPNYALYLTKNMYIVWFGCFVEKFQPICNTTGKGWSLIPYLDRTDFILRHTESAKVRFTCWNCGNIWTSMFGSATFTVYENNGYVLSYKLLGQKCTKCHSDEFEFPTWYPEEVERVLENVSKAILHMDIQPKFNRAGNPQSSHKPQYCQACAENICRSRINSDSYSFQEYGKADEDNDCDERERVHGEHHDDLSHFTSDYESENDFGSILDARSFRRSLSMPVKPMKDLFV